MSSSDSEGLIPTINEGSSIPELIKLIKHTFLEREFNEVQNILMDRENKMKIEIENLRRDRDLIGVEVRLLERSQGLAELEKLKFQDKLQMSQRNCEVLKETVTSLVEEKKVLCDRQKMADERVDKVCAENYKMIIEKDKFISEFSEKINELKSRNSESERLVGTYQEKIKCLDSKLVKMSQEIVDLKHEKLAVDQTVKELRRKQLEADQVVEELKNRNVEATQIIDELRQKKLESGKAAELYKCQLEKLAPRIMKVEDELANMLMANVVGLGNLSDSLDEPAAANERNVDFIDLEGEEGSSGNGSRWNSDAENMAVMSLRVRSTSRSTGEGCIELSNKGICEKGGRNLVPSSTKKDCSNTVLSPPGSLSGCPPPPPQARINVTDQDHERNRPQGSAVKSKLLKGSGGRNLVQSSTGKVCSNTVQSPPGSQSGRTPCQVKINVTDQDNEGGRNLVQSSTETDGSNAVQSPPASHSGRTSSQAKNNVIDQDNERNGPQGSGVKSKAFKCSGTHTSGKHSDGGVSVGRQTMFGAGSSSKIACCSSADRDIIEIPDSDDETNPNGVASISDTGANKMIFKKSVQNSSSSQTKKRNKIDFIDDSVIDTSTKRKRSICGSAGDNLPIVEKEDQARISTHNRIGSVHKDFSVKPISDNGLSDEDSSDSKDESCTDSYMNNLVATMSRNWVLQADMIKALLEDTRLCMDAVCALYRQKIFARKPSERALAEYLIDGDKELRRRNSVSDVKRQRPEVLSQCQRLAITHDDKLFEIYCSGKDPFFRRT